MAVGPFGPWLRVAPSAGDSKPPGPLERAGLLDRAKIYRGLLKVSGGNIGPRQADQLYLWEIGVLLGNSEELDESNREGAPEGSNPEPVVDFNQYALRKIEQRIRAAETGEPEPEAEPFDPTSIPVTNR